MPRIVCPHCSTPVELTRENQCPHCRKFVDPAQQEGPDRVEVTPADNVAHTKRWRELAVEPRAPWLTHLTSYAVSFVGGIIGIALLLAGGKVWNDQGLSTHVKSFSMAFFCLAGSIPLYLLNLGKRLRSESAMQSTKDDSRPPVLLLRSFADDRTPVLNEQPGVSMLGFAQSIHRTLEEVLTDLFSKSGPVVALGSPNEMAAPLGASRVWISNNDWPNAIDDLLNEAQLVVTIMGNIAHRSDDQGLKWEIKRILESPALYKTVFVVPPIAESEIEHRWNEYRRLSDRRLTEYRGGEVAAMFRKNGSCDVAYCRKNAFGKYEREDVVYQNALDLSKRNRG